MHIAVPGGGHASLIVERELALRLAERRMEAGTTFAEMVRAGDPDLVQLLLVRIAEHHAEHQAVDLDNAVSISRRNPVGRSFSRRPAPRSAARWHRAPAVSAFLPAFGSGAYCPRFA